MHARICTPTTSCAHGLLPRQEEFKRVGLGIISAAKHRRSCPHLGQNLKQENILKAITSAIAYLEGSIEARVKKDKKLVAHFAWRAASDLEYALFLFSLMHQNETESSTWKPMFHKQQLEIGSLLDSTQTLLKEAKNSFTRDELYEAHKKTWIARHHLLRLHDFLEKEKRKDMKTSS